MRSVKLIVALLLLGGVQCALAQPTERDPKTIVRETVSRAPHDPPGQARLLVQLAWPDEGYDPEVSAEAIYRLLDFGIHGIPVLREAVTSVQPRYRSEVVAALIESFRRLDGGLPTDYLPAIEEAIWFGTREARLKAIPEAARFGVRPALLPMIDAAIEDPELLPLVVESLGIMRDDRARFFLQEQLVSGSDEIKTAAAASLARIGRKALGPLREAVASPDPAVRIAAVRALLPVATVEDLVALYEFYGTHADDDPQVAAQVRETVLRLEQLLQAQQTADAASPAPDQ